MHFPDVTIEHASQLNFAFDARFRSLASWTHTRSHIEGYESQIKAHLAAVTADSSTAKTLTWVDETPGDIFAQAATLISLDADVSSYLTDKLTNAPHLLLAAAAALTAQTAEKANALAKKWLAGNDELTLALAVAASPRLSSKEPVTSALRSEEALVRLAGLLALPAEAVDSNVSTLQKLADGDDATTRFHAAVCLALADNAAGLATLESFLDNSRYRWQALRLLGAKQPEPALRDLARKLAKDEVSLALAARLAGYAGRTNAIPRLLQFLDDPGCATYAAEAFSLITGVDYALQGMVALPPDETPLLSGDDEGVTLPYPDIDAVREWWTENGAGLNAEVPLLLGRPRDESWCNKVLEDSNMHVTTFTSILMGVPAPTCLF